MVQTMPVYYIVTTETLGPVRLRDLARLTQKDRLQPGTAGMGTSDTSRDWKFPICDLTPKQDVLVRRRPCEKSTARALKSCLDLRA